MKNADSYPEEETARHRDEAIHRALNTPPKPLKDRQKTRAKKKNPASRPTPKALTDY